MGIVGILIGVVSALVVTAVIFAAIAFFLISHFEAIPKEHRRLQPKEVWLLAIPLFNLYWNFKVFPGLSESYKSYFDSTGRTDVGDCGRQIGLFYSIAAALSIIPCVNMVTGLASLVLIIIYFLKITDLKKLVVAA